MRLRFNRDVLQEILRRAVGGQAPRSRPARHSAASAGGGRPQAAVAVVAMEGSGPSWYGYAAFCQGDESEGDGFGGEHLGKLLVEVLPPEGPCKWRQIGRASCRERV
eukprot:TRINITY_DN27246_c0_g1_i2.p3 TRINITY_DN27246_c0_g1~~TRINITY_DN27246_c0_g1_i2.p3  ORF type:complete len:107 (+),score=1.70 TRINITY_DN27246_c0_g1_i2:23-343(+)